MPHLNANDAQRQRTFRIGVALLVASMALFAAASYIDLSDIKPGHLDPNILRIGLNRFLLFVLPALFLVTGMLLLEFSGRTVQNRFALAAGDASYSIYILHPFFLTVLLKVGMRLGAGSTPFLAFAWLMFCWILIFITGVLSFKLIEKPSNDFLRKRLVGKSVRRQVETENLFSE